MRKTLSLLAALVAVLAIYSCKDIDDSANPYTHYATITVDSANVTFPAAPSTGSITVTAPGGITRVTSTASWCTATANGNVVSIAATLNDKLEERASQITIWSGDDSTQVTVQQMGFILQLETGNADNSIVVTNDNATTRKFYMKHNVDVTLTAKEDWVNARMVGDSLEVTLAENATGNPREAYVYYAAGTLRDSLRVTQYDNDKDVAGDYDLAYINSKSQWTSTPVNIYKKKDGKYSMKFLSGTFAKNGFEIPVELSNEYPCVTVCNLDSVGMYTYKEVEYHTILLVMFTDGSSAYRTRSVIRAEGNWLQQNGGNYYVFSTDNDLGTDYYFYALRLALSTDGTYAKLISTSVITFTYAELDREPAGAAKKQGPVRIGMRM